MMKNTTIDIKVIGLHHETGVTIDDEFNENIIFDYEDFIRQVIFGNVTIQIYGE